MSETNTPRVRVTVAYPDRDDTEWLLAYPRRGDFLLDDEAEMWEVTRVTWVPVPKAECIVTVDKPHPPEGTP